MPKTKTTNPRQPQIDWLQSEVARLEADATAVDDGEDAATGLSHAELHLLEQYRHELRGLDGTYDDAASV